MKKVLIAAVTLISAATMAFAQHPGVQPRPDMTMQTTVGDTTFVNVGTSPLPIGQNRLAYVEQDLRDGRGIPIPNTLPSTPAVQFNLHDGPVQISDIDRNSPKDVLNAAIDAVRQQATHGDVDLASIQKALDVLEGNEIPGNDTYSRFALLHYTAGERVKAVSPVTRNVDIHQIWYDNHIESDTALLDISAVMSVPFTVTYTIDVLTGGADDFSPFVMYWDDPTLSPPGMPPMPLCAMDTTFFPMNEGKRYVIKIKHAPGMYYNLTYTWGWRIHPPRVQATENAGKFVGFNPDGSKRFLKQYETDVFGENPRSSEATKLAAIAKIGELAPAKRLWQAFRDASTATPAQIVALMDDARLSFNDWADRTRLPRGVTADTTANATLFYVNNTLYGNIKKLDSGDWTSRGWTYKVAILNGDHFDHAYVNVDFGGSRGWENQFDQRGGPGGSHTFGRAQWWMNTALPLNSITIPAVAADGTPTRRRVEIALNYDKPERIALYQFDPLHHDVAVYSIH